MLICFEGLDKSGKSTLIEEVLRQRPMCMVFRKPVPESLSPDDFSAYFRGVGMAVASIHGRVPKPILVDRSYISDWVYSNGEFLGWHRWAEWEFEVVEISQAAIVYVSVSRDTQAQRLRDSPDPYCSEDDVIEFQRRYEDYFKRTSLPVIRVNGSGDISANATRVVSLIDNGH